jgi:hypothetical protein
MLAQHAFDIGLIIDVWNGGLKSDLRPSFAGLSFAAA